MAGLEQLQRALELLLAPTAFPLEAIAPDERILLQRLATPVLDPPADEPESPRQHHYRAADHSGENVGSQNHRTTSRSAASARLIASTRPLTSGFYG
ncbi:MAG: hypothetical protein DMD29_00785 [Gemmatimonadetes bacterium]|nr:MAG: hypothetical protein DMD29_00785 [Gemmatimonadota bacterium]